MIQIGEGIIMGTVIVMAYSTSLFANQADHTYVKCGTGKRAWGCWGGKSGGRVLRRGNASTKRCDKIAQPDERAGIKCYLINGVCHQAANRILLPAGVTVKGARGYSISEALFGTYGRVGFWPCKSPFNQYKNETGDLPECVEPPVKAEKIKMAAVRPLSETDKLDWHYIKGVLALYDKAAKMMMTKAVGPDDAEGFHIELFMYMAEFHLGPMLDKGLKGKLKKVRSKTEKIRVKAETVFNNNEMTSQEFVGSFNKTTIEFQEEMAGVMKPEQYETIFDLKPDDHVILADQKIVKKAFG